MTQILQALAVQMPPVMPIDLTALVATVLGILIVLIPVAGLTARYALKPMAEAVAKMRESQAASRDLSLVEQRLSLAEQQLAGLEEDVRRLDEVVEFDRQLSAGQPPGGASES